MGSSASMCSGDNTATPAVNDDVNRPTGSSMPPMTTTAEPSCESSLLRSIEVGPANATADSGSAAVSTKSPTSPILIQRPSVDDTCDGHQDGNNSSSILNTHSSAALKSPTSPSSASAAGWSRSTTPLRHVAENVEPNSPHRLLDSSIAPLPIREGHASPPPAPVGLPQFCSLHSVKRLDSTPKYANSVVSSYNSIADPELGFAVSVTTAGGDGSITDASRGSMILSSRN